MSYQEEARNILYRTLSNLDKQERKELLLLASKWNVVEKNLEGLIKELAEAEVKSKNQLFQLDLYKQFLAESKTQINKYSALANEVISDYQLVNAKAGIDSTSKLINLLGIEFNKLPAEVVKNMIGLSSDGSPLYELLIKSYPDTVDKLIDTLINSTALGRNPVETARLMKEDMQGNLARALRIARTEQMNVFRETSRMQMEKAELNKWEWLIEDDEIVCDFCISQSGTIHPIDEPMDTHPNCRCAMLPVIE